MKKRTATRSQTDSALRVEPGTYVLRRGRGFWQVVFDGRHVIIREELGLRYVAELLLHHRNQPVHCVELDALLRGTRQDRAGAGNETFLLQQRSLCQDDIDYLQKLRVERAELLEMIDDENEVEPVKLEAQEQLEAIDHALKSHLAKTVDVAARRIDSVRRAIDRFQRRLASALDAAGRPHPVLRAFGEHLLLYLLLPSGRRSRGGRHAAAAKASYVYSPPSGVVWTQQ